MEIHEIRYFLATCETLNFTRAAEQCHVSQPALTRAVKNLEDKLGAGPLIHRERNNTHLTELGRIMKPYFEQVLAQMEQAKAKARAYVRLDGTSLTVGVMCTIGPLKLVDLFASFNRRFQGIDIHLKDGPVGALEEHLAKGEVDIAICCRPEELDDRFHVVPLFRERFVVAVAPDHPLARLESIRMRDLHNQRYLSRSNCEYYDYLRNIRERLGGIDLICPYRSERDDWIQSMVLAGLGFTYLPEYAVTLPGLVVRPLVDPEVHRVVRLVTVRGRPHSPAVGAFVHEARTHKWESPARPVSPAAHLVPVAGGRPPAADDGAWRDPSRRSASRALSS